MSRRLVAMAEIDMAELAVRMVEANYGLKRPKGSSGIAALAAMDDEAREGWLRSAKVAAEYLAEIFNNPKAVQ